MSHFRRVTLWNSGPHSAFHKTGDDRWYETLVPIADRLFDDHLNELKKEGKI